MTSSAKAHLALASVAVIYGLNYSIAKGVMPEYLGPSGFILVRAIGASALFWLLRFGRKQGTIARKHWPRLAACGFLGVALNQLMFFNGLNLTTPIHASILMTGTPVLVLLIGAVAGTESFRPIRALGVFLGLVGAAHLVLRGNWTQWQWDQTARGDLMILVNATSYSAYLVAVKPLMRHYDPALVIRWVFAVGLVLVLPFGWDQMAAASWGNFPAGIWGAIAFVVIGTTFFAYLLNIFALKTVTSSTVAAYIYLQPVIATTVSLLLGQERAGWDQLVAAALVFSGVYLVSLYKPKST